MGIDDEDDSCDNTHDDALDSSGRGSTHQLGRELDSSLDKKMTMTMIAMVVTVHTMVR